MIDHEIVYAITNYANQGGSGYHNWYCGIASDPELRLFNEHNVPHREGRGRYIARDAGNEQNARDTEAHLLELGFDGDTGGGDHTTIHVYAYRKIPGVTRE
jgi:hypothetical protein